MTNGYFDGLRYMIRFHRSNFISVTSQSKRKTKPFSDLLYLSFVRL